MKIIDETVYNTIGQIYPGITADDLFEKKGKFTQISISAFSHWLTEEEADDILLNSNECIKNELSLLQFYRYLFNQYFVCFYISSDYGSGTFMQFSSLDEYQEWVNLSIKERLFLRLVIPELKVIINGGYDYTLPTFLTKDADITLLEKIVREHGLYSLKGAVAKKDTGRI